MRTKLLVFLLILVIAFPLTGVLAQGDGMGEVIELPPVDPALVSGDIVVAGSSTVFPLTTRMVERFEQDLYSGTITIDSIGSGAGFERFCVEGITDISNASRPIDAEEVAACQSIGRDPLEFRVGTDALAVTVSQENDFIDNITLEQLGMIFTGEAQTWADVNPDWPAEEIQLFSPGTDSGTFDYFVEAVLEPLFEDAEDPGEAAAAAILAAEPQLSEDDNVLVQGVIGSPYAIGYFGYAYYQENSDTLKILNINEVEPTAASVEDGSYALARPLFIYSAASVFAEKPQVADFINYYLAHVQEEVVDVGYFPASDASLNLARYRLWSYFDSMGME